MKTDNLAPQAEGDPTRFYLTQQHFLQSGAWARFQRARGNEVIERAGITAAGDAWSYLAIVERGRFSSRLYCPYGPTCSTASALSEALEALQSDGRERRLDFVRIEPRGAWLLTGEDREGGGRLPSMLANELGLIKAAHDVQPPDTIINDVRAAVVREEDILQRASQTRRQLYRYSLRDGVSYRTSFDPNDLHLFLEMIHVVAERTGMQPHPDAYFETIAKTLFAEKAAGMLLSELGGEPLATIIFFADDTSLAYAHAASVEGHRKLSPPSGLLMHAQLFARTRGLAVFDTYGVAPLDADAEHPWAGFTRFKLSFGGERVHTPGTWELPLRKLRHSIYNKIGTLLEK